ncbi:ABC transporter integral membrane protein [Streptomyces venezuelae]|uniref:ABC transporter permease n=1 Tax=Streptomyces gardneri TaxID=66892 RepID=UPI0006BD6B13|nr:ABC transporter permease [Streptomyces gardneri]ALO07978.1 ABC transporter integral membrane protein [Streptomyces venezuelae]QPK45263.1 ABC transporter permease [Streptomyces gardneri]WRK36582.1 ABC transporter permease [Streptomyces venezuelae]CUM41680.1 Thiamin ABC transporter, transmembrane component [Streptomyces venezuelae]
MITAYVRLEVRRTLRDAGFTISTIGVPVMMYLLFTNLGTDDGSFATPAMVGMAAYGALGAALSLGTGVAEDKSTGWLRQLRVTPMTPRQVVTGRALTGSVVVLPAIAGVLLAGGLANGVRMAAWQWAAVALTLWLGSLPFTLLGIGNGYRLSAQTTGVVNVACNLGLAVVGGLWFPTVLFPSWLRAISEYTPTNRFAELGVAMTEGTAPGAGALAVLAVWTALFGMYAAVSYRRSARTV